MKINQLILIGLVLFNTSLYSQRNKKEVIKTVSADQSVTINNLSIDKEMSTIRISIYEYIPYCGGAYPDESQLNNNHPIGNTEFVLIDLKDSSKTIVTTNANGVLELLLPFGNYAIQETFKNCTFAEFMQNNNNVVSGNYYQNGDTDCYKTWWSSYLGTFTLVDSSQEQFLNFSRGSACFTGNNPCLYYNGPYHP